MLEESPILIQVISHQLAKLVEFVLNFILFLAENHY
jgi:hypothetical protein